MNNITFDLFSELTEKIVGVIESNDDFYVSLVGKYERIRDIIKMFLCYDNIVISGIQLTDENINGYSDEYILCLWEEDGEIFLDCEPLKKNGKYLVFDGDEVYIFDGCNAKVLTCCESDNIYFISECDDCFECCDSCEYYCSKK